MNKILFFFFFILCLNGIAQVAYPPVANDDLRKYCVGTTTSFTVLNNDYDPNWGDQIRIYAHTNPSFGTIVASEDAKSFTYTSTGNANDSFMYQIADLGDSLSNFVTVTLIPVDNTTVQFTNSNQSVLGCYVDNITNVTIPPSTNKVIEAVKSVILLPNTEIQAGSVVEIKISNQ